MADDLANLRVLVLYGGPGVEREVSLESGANVAGALRDAGLDVELCDVRDEDDVRALRGDIAIPMLHGEFGEDGRLQAALAGRGLGFCGSDAAACALAMDKDATKRRLAEAGIPSPAGVKLAEPERWRGPEGARALDARLADAGLAPPLAVKPNARGSSVGVTLVRAREELPAALARAFAVDDAALVERCVEGREVTVGWLDGTPLPIVELLPPEGSFYDYHAKYASDRTRYACPAPLPEGLAARLRGHAELACRTLGLRDLARVDFLLDGDGEPYLLEVNTLPGFTSHSLFPMAAKAAGWSFGALCVWLARRAAARRVSS